MTTTPHDTDTSTGPDPLLDVEVDAGVEALMSPDASFLEWVHQLDDRRETTRVALLAELKDAKAVRAAAEVRVLRCVLDWCIANEALEDDEAMWLAGYGDHGLSLGGPGCPLVRESAVIELAAALGLHSLRGQPGRPHPRAPVPTPAVVGPGRLRGVPGLEGTPGRGEDDELVRGRCWRDRRPRR